MSRNQFQRTITRIHKLDEVERFFMKRRVILANYIVFLLIIILAARLWHLQILNGADFRERSNSNRTKSLNTIAPRGNILDRSGKILVSNRPCFNVVWLRPDRKDSDRVIRKLASILKVETGVLLDRIRDAADQSRYIPVTLASDVDWQTLVYIENNNLNLPGVKIQVIPKRRYADPGLGFHLMGYLGEIGLKDLKSFAGIYEGGDLIGKSGIERMLESDLRGEKGHMLLEIDSRGFLKKQVEVVKSLPGRDVYLTIDADLQKTAQEALGDNAGAVVVMEVNTGRVLALASTPACDLERFSDGLDEIEWAALMHDKRNPLMNRAIQGKYPPGSTFKVVTAIAGLYEGLITPETKIQCNGAIRYGNRIYRCWKHSGHGQVDLKKALAQSCDVYFYRLAEKLGIDTLAAYSRALGLGEATGISLGQEKAGLVATSEWKRRKTGEPWQQGETLSVAIGQGFSEATPIQICRLYATIANGGILYRPLLTERLVNPDGRTVKEFAPEPSGRFDDPDGVFRLIREALVQAVNGEHGTGSRAALEEVTVAGKTGTSQVVHTSRYEGFKEEDIPRKYRDHAWFACFAPAEKPEVAVAVLVEHGGHGGSAAAPIAGKVLKRYFAEIIGEKMAQAPGSETETTDLSGSVGRNGSGNLIKAEE